MGPLLDPCEHHELLLHRLALSGMLLFQLLTLSLLGHRLHVCCLGRQEVRLELDHLDSLWVEDGRRLRLILLLQRRTPFTFGMKNVILAEGTCSEKLTSPGSAPEAAAGGGRPRSPTSMYPTSLVALAREKTQVGPESLNLSCHVCPSTSMTDKGEVDMSTGEVHLQSRHTCRKGAPR